MSTVRRVPVGTYEVEVDVDGSGAPPIVYVAGTGGGSRCSFAATVDALPPLETTQVFYTRPGITEDTGHDTGPTVGAPGAGTNDDLSGCAARSFTEAGAELRGVLEAADVAGPFVMVGHSIGASIIEAYALSWPEEIAAVVLVDASSMEFNRASAKYAEIVRDGDTGIPFDVVRGAADLSAGDPPAVPAWVVTCRPKRWLDLPDELYAGWAPLTRDELDDRWQDAQARLAERWRATQWIATVGGHRVQVDQPDLVARAIVAAWTAARDATRNAGSIDATVVQ